MAIIDLSNTNKYPYIKRVSITSTAQEITIPAAATRISIGSSAALYFANEGDDGDAFGGVGIANYAFIPANNILAIDMETGRQSNRKLLVGTQSGSADLSIIIEKQ
jgi:hypothetical protein